MPKKKNKKNQEEDPYANEFGHSALPLRHVPEQNNKLLRTNMKKFGERIPMKLEFEHEKFTKLANNKELPSWAVDSRKVVAERQLRRENLHDIKLGMSEFLYRDIQKSQIVVQGWHESRFNIESRPLGVIGLSNDDCFIRSLSSDAKPDDHLCPGNECWKVTAEEEGSSSSSVPSPDEKLSGKCNQTQSLMENNSDTTTKQIPSSSSQQKEISAVAHQQNTLQQQQSSSTSSTNKFKNYQPQIIDTPTGLDIAPLPKDAKKKAVFVLKLMVTAGTPPESIVNGLRQLVQGARHRSHLARDEFVPCEVRFEANSNGFLCSTLNSSMEVHCRVRTWTAAHHCLLPNAKSAKSFSSSAGTSNSKNGVFTKHNNNNNNDNDSSKKQQSLNLYEFTGVKHGRFSIINCWTLDEWKQQTPIKQPSLTEYNLLIRGTPEVPMKSIFEPLKKIRDEGFINYCSQYYFGMSIENSAAFARAFLEGRYTSCFIHHFLCLAAASRPCTDAVFQLKRRLQVVYGGENQGFVGNANNQKGGSTSSSSSSSAMTRNLKFEWKAFIGQLESALDSQKHTSSFMKSTPSDVDFTPLHKLLEIAKHIEQLDGDCTRAMVEHCLIPDTIVQWHLRSLSDLHFNALASIRIKRYGPNKVVPGDVVCVDEEFREKLDVIQAPNFVVPCSNALTFDRSIESALTKYLLSSLSDEEEREITQTQKPPLLKLVESESEAKEYKPSSVVLPKWGIVPDELLSSMGNNNSNKMLVDELENNNNNNNNSHLDRLHFDWIHHHQNKNAPLPTAGGIDHESCAKISRALNIPSATATAMRNSGAQAVNELHQKLLSQITYRPLFMKPRWLFAHCWDNRSILSSSNFGLDARYAKEPNLHLFPTDEDVEGWRRMLTLGSNLYEKELGSISMSNINNTKNASSSPISAVYQSSAEQSALGSFIVPGKIRPSVKPAEVRELLMNATIPKKAITTGLRVALPTGAALSAVLREVFQVSVVESKEVSGALEEGYRMMNRHKRRIDHSKALRQDRKVFGKKKGTSMEF